MLGEGTAPTRSSSGSQCTREVATTQRSCRRATGAITWESGPEVATANAQLLWLGA